MPPLFTSSPIAPDSNSKISRMNTADASSSDGPLARTNSRQDSASNNIAYDGYYGSPQPNPARRLLYVPSHAGAAQQNHASPQQPRQQQLQLHRRHTAPSGQFYDTRQFPQEQQQQHRFPLHQQPAQQSYGYHRGTAAEMTGYSPNYNYARQISQPARVETTPYDSSYGYGQGLDQPTHAEPFEREVVTPSPPPPAAAASSGREVAAPARKPSLFSKLLSTRRSARSGQDELIDLINDDCPYEDGLDEEGGELSDEDIEVEYDDEQEEERAALDDLDAETYEYPTDGNNEILPSHPQSGGEEYGYPQWGAGSGIMEGCISQTSVSSQNIAVYPAANSSQGSVENIYIHQDGSSGVMKGHATQNSAASQSGVVLPEGNLLRGSTGNISAERAGSGVMMGYMSQTSASSNNSAIYSAATLSQDSVENAHMNTNGSSGVIKRYFPQSIAASQTGAVHRESSSSQGSAGRINTERARSGATMKYLSQSSASSHNSAVYPAASLLQGSVENIRMHESRSSGVMEGYISQSSAASHNGATLPGPNSFQRNAESISIFDPNKISFRTPSGNIPFRKPDDRSTTPYAPATDGDASVAVDAADDIAESFFGRPLMEIESCEREADTLRSGGENINTHKTGSSGVTGYISQSSTASHNGVALTGPKSSRGSAESISIFDPNKISFRTPSKNIPFREPDGRDTMTSAPATDEDASVAVDAADDIAESLFGRPLMEMESCEREVDVHLPSIRRDDPFRGECQLAHAQDSAAMQDFTGYQYADAAQADADATTEDDIAESFFGRPFEEMASCEKEADVMLPSIRRGVLTDSSGGHSTSSPRPSAAMNGFKSSQDDSTNVDAAEDIAESFFGRPLMEMETWEKEMDELLPSIGGVDMRINVGGHMTQDSAAAKSFFKGPRSLIYAKSGVAVGSSTATSYGDQNCTGGDNAPQMTRPTTAASSQLEAPQPMARDGYVSQLGKFLWRSVKTIFTFSARAAGNPTAHGSSDMDV